MKQTNKAIKQLTERLFLAMFTTFAIVGISIIHENLEQSVVNYLLQSDSQAELTVSSQFLNSPTQENLAFVCPTP